MLPTWAEHSGGKISWDGAQEGVKGRETDRKTNIQKEAKPTEDLT